MAVVTTFGASAGVVVAACQLAGDSAASQPDKIADKFCPVFAELFQVVLPQPIGSTVTGEDAL